MQLELSHVGSNRLSRSDDRPLHVAIVDEELPYPAVTGKRIRTWNLLRRLAERHRLTYLCHRNADAAEAERAEACLRDHGIETIVVERRVPAKRGPGFYARLAANLASPVPYSVATHTSRALSDAVKAHAATSRVDLWHCEWTPYAAVLAGVRGPKLVMAHNVESQIWQRYHETEANVFKRWYIGQQWRKFVRFERAVAQNASLMVAVSDEDAAQFRTDFGARDVAVVENGVDVDYFRPSAAPIHPQQILFLGSLDWRPNLDAVALLLDTIFPAVQRQERNARLVIVGRNPPDWLQRRAASMPGVEVHGNVADVRPFLAASAVMAVPLRIGGGSRLKILESLASGLPVVSTRIGAEGLRLRDGEHLDIVSSPEEMPAALVRALHETSAARAQAQRGREVVLREYAWDGLAEKLEQAWRRSAVAV